LAPDETTTSVFSTNETKNEGKILNIASSVASKPKSFSAKIAKYVARR
jgi:hypothetical protein